MLLDSVTGTGLLAFSCQLPGKLSWPACGASNRFHQLTSVSFGATDGGALKGWRFYGQVKRQRGPGSRVLCGHHVEDAQAGLFCESASRQKEGALMCSISANVRLACESSAGLAHILHIKRAP